MKFRGILHCFSVFHLITVSKSFSSLSPMNKFLKEAKALVSSRVPLLAVLGNESCGK